MEEPGRANTSAPKQLKPEIRHFGSIVNIICLKAGNFGIFFYRSYFCDTIVPTINNDFFSFVSGDAARVLLGSK